MVYHHRLLFNTKSNIYALAISQNFHELAVKSDNPPTILKSNAFIKAVPIFGILVTQLYNTENAENLAIKLEKNLIITKRDVSRMQLLNFTWY